MPAFPWIRALPLALLGGALFLLALWLTRDPPETFPPRPGSAAETADPTEPRLRGRTAAPPSVEDPVPATPVPPAPAPPPPAIEAAGDEATSTWLLRGEVRGLDPTLADVARLRIYTVRTLFADTEHGIDGEVEADGRVDMDVTDLLRTPHNASGLEIVVDHPAYAKARTRIDLAAGGTGTVRILPFSIEVRRTHAVIGRVLSEGGDPVPEAMVALFVVRGDEPAQMQVLPAAAADETTTDEDGTFRLRTLLSGEFLVVATHRRRSAAARRAVRPTDADLELGPLVLGRGVAIDGRVTWEGRPVPGASIDVEPTDGWPLNVGRHGVFWTGGTAVFSARQSETDDEGRYRLEGLAPGRYRVSATAYHLPGIDCVTQSWSALRGQEVEAPASNVILTVQGRHLRLRVRGGGKPVPGAGVTLSQTGVFLSAATGEDGVLDALLTGQGDTRVETRADGYRPATLTVEETAEPGRVDRDVELEPAEAEGALVFVVEGADSASTRHLAIRATPAAGASTGPPRHAQLEVQNGRARLEGLRPGPYAVRVVPARQLVGPSGFYRPTEHAVEVPVGGEIEIVLRPEIGGRFRIAARDESGGLLEAHCVVRDEYGVDRRVQFCTQTETIALSRGMQLGPYSASLVEPPLPPGRYTIELHLEGHGERTLEAEVKAGETTDVDVTLTTDR